jgi:hypothetical protein
MGEEAAEYIETKLGDIEDAETKEVKLSSSIHLPFNTFEPIFGEAIRRQLYYALNKPSSGN